MKKAEVSLNIGRSSNGDAITNYSIGSNQEVAAVINTEKVIKEEEIVVKADSSFDTVIAAMNIERENSLTNNSFAIEEDDEEVRISLENGLRSNSNKEVEVKYTIGDSDKTASINQSIVTNAKESSSYITDTKEAKADVTIEESKNTRIQDVEQLMGD